MTKKTYRGSDGWMHTVDVPRNAAKVRARRNERIERGLCGQCGEAPLVNKTRCEPCRQDHCEDSRLRRSDRSRTSRRASKKPGTSS
jgi:hypothetical protein